MTTSLPSSVTPYAMDLPPSRWRVVQAMNFSKPSTVGGGGEIRRVTSALPSDASNAVASLGRNSRSVMIDPFRIGKPLRQSWRVAGAGVDLSGVTSSAVRVAILLLPSCRRAPDDVVDIVRAPDDVVPVCAPDYVVAVGSPDDVVVVGSPDDVVEIEGAPNDVVGFGAPDD